MSSDWRELPDDPDMRRVLDVLQEARDQIGALTAELREARCDEIAVLGQAQEAHEQLQRLRAVCERLIAAYDEEETEHGFPFNFRLRQAHRELCALITNTKPEEG